MATLIEVYGIYTNITPSMGHRIQAALVEWCEPVFSEDAGTANHAARLQFAQACLVQEKREKAVQMLLPLFATNTDFQTSGDAFTDGAIAWVVNHYLTEPGVLAGLLATL